MSYSADTWIEFLQLAPHPEGGYFRRTYCATETVVLKALPPRFSGDRAFSSAIYYLLTSEQFSALHRIQADELWHFYAGSPLNLYSIDTEGNLQVIQLGIDVMAGQRPQAVVRAGCWFGAEVAVAQSYALLGCTVAPAFDFNDFILGERAELLALYPQHHALITRLTL